MLKLLGSSPRVWGQALVARVATVYCGIIPTRVGTRQHKVRYCNNNGDHPHACGDKLASAFNMDKVEGSSPRVWGQVFSGIRKNRFMRIIPTRVGTSLSFSPITSVAGDHPHACGDKKFTVSAVNVQQGSSPRVWGQD